MKKMLFSIGYQRIETVDKLASILQRREVKILIDVRFKPCSRRDGFNKPNLKAALRKYGIDYIHAGETLGDLVRITEPEIKGLAEWYQKKRLNLCLLCVEEDPTKCHRKFEIPRRLPRYDVEVRRLKVDWAIETVRNGSQQYYGRRF
ncbi:MAG: DUF488 domain-containing protein [Desulfobacterales bacterium]|nr:MAG: DUF488 domain-containing protein [Desulfobacterales bacterium]